MKKEITVKRTQKDTSSVILSPPAVMLSTSSVILSEAKDLRPRNTEQEILHYVQQDRGNVQQDRKGRAKTALILCMSAVLLFSGCNAKDPLYNTAHPDHGQITLTTDWTARDAGVDIPASYTVAAGEYATTVNDATNTLDHLFNPGACHLRVYNTPEHITVNGATVTVSQTTAPVMLSEAKHLPAQSTEEEILRYAQNDNGNAQNDKSDVRNDSGATHNTTDNVDGVGRFVQPLPGWLFTSVQDTTIEADTDHYLTATMHQQVRQLTLFIEPTGGTADRIERIEGYLTGAASMLDMDNGTHSTPLNVALTFTKVAHGADAGKWTATVRLLGVAGTEQKLHARIFFEGDSPQTLPLTDADGNEGSDLTSALADFNKDKKTPLTLGCRIVETPTSTGFTATITDWTPVTGGSVMAH